MNETKARILCVDDEPGNLDLLEAMLVPNGYEVVISEDGRDALKLIAEQKIDLVLLDVLMPGIDGFEVCRKIKGNECYRSIPVVMITELTSKEERVKGIEAGAEDFISKPIYPNEVLARIRMLLKNKGLNDGLTAAFNTIHMAGFEEAMSFNSFHFDILSRIDGIVKDILRIRPDMTDRAEAVVIGYCDDKNVWQWYRFNFVHRELHWTWLKTDFCQDLHILPESVLQTYYYNTADLGRPEYQSFIERLSSLSIPVSNMVCLLSSVFCIIALNYGRNVSRYDAEVMKSIVMQSCYVKALTSQVTEMEKAFDGLVFSFARAAEANDENAGNHILRVGEYCATLAWKLGLSKEFCNNLRVQAALHDVGKIHIHPDILRKPGELTPEEFGEIKKHTLNGSTILGNHTRLAVAKHAALSHHERWDGSGYPHGLRGEQIPLEGRILTIADQYDALRNVRVYKAGFDHDTACRILIKGDGRTMPHHFDPQALRAFKETAPQFGEIYKNLKD